MGTAERLYELAKVMSEDQAAELLDFAEFLLQKAEARSKQGIAEDRTQPGRLLSDYAGILKNSPTFQGDPVEIQRQLRNEWD
ncbi:MAG: DUF2281 domain-containing protein [Phormidesmis sp. CAN_BIN44]|nr:DUF2281 domain-containing protein [Phormidesmis sp. CAN_BIN44]